MKLLYLCLLLAALIALNWRFLGFDRLFERLVGRGGGCSWRVDPSMQASRFGRYVCDRCGAEAFTSNGRPPRQCRKDGPPR